MSWEVNTSLVLISTPSVFLLSENCILKSECFIKSSYFFPALKTNTSMKLCQKVLMLQFHWKSPQNVVIWNDKS